MSDLTREEFMRRAEALKQGKSIRKAWELLGEPKPKYEAFYHWVRRSDNKDWLRAVGVPQQVLEKAPYRVRLTDAKAEYGFQCLVEIREALDGLREHANAMAYAECIGRIRHSMDLFDRVTKSAPDRSGGLREDESVPPEEGETEAQT